MAVARDRVITPLTNATKDFHPIIALNKQPLAGLAACIYFVP